MNKFILLLLTSVVAISLNAQDVLSECQPQTYNSTPIMYQPQINPCKWVGAVEVQPIGIVIYKTIQVEALSQFPTYLPKGYMTYQRGNLWIVVMHPTYWDSLGEEWAILKSQEDGFCNYKNTTITTNPFPGTYSSY